MKAEGVVIPELLGSLNGWLGAVRVAAQFGCEWGRVKGKARGLLDGSWLGGKLGNGSVEMVNRKDDDG
ncbi:hypothetical protein V6N12_068436 [Hibiscus sabdariffa]|uniref:Uncharacterized protein n=1 Tax=Hibiscus sabdariffa TaxID=183260 RepID=A0ABR2FQA1_9ROSI